MGSIKDKSCWMVKENVIKNYLSICRKAAESDEYFSLFKSHQHYNEILEHVSSKIAHNYYENVLIDNPWLLDIKSIYENDLLGGPDYFPTFGKIKCSPSTMQYIGVLSNLIKLVNPDTLADSNIIEIGGGYGGQCKVIDSAFEFLNYHIVDLEEPSLLQEKYLNRVGVENFTTLTSENYKYGLLGEYDLVISNYALSEVLEPLQTEYITNICLRSKHGYITCNRELKSIELLKEKFDTFSIQKDIAGELETNFIITW